MIKNQVRAILGKVNLSFPGSDVFGIKGKQWLKQQPLSEAQRQMVDIYLERLADLEKAIKDLEAIINQKSDSLPEVKLLTSIPGVGTTTAFLLASEIGDIQRFGCAKQFASYFGLVPRLNQSGNHAYYGRITKLGNPFVRWSLVQAAHRLARTNPNFQRFVGRIAFKGGKKKAIVALARKLSTIVFCILKENRPYIKNYQCLKVRPAIIPDPD
jgi:transposase